MSVASTVSRLQAHGLTLAIAESCTGGMLGAEITKIPGVSSFFLGGVIAYADESKARLLGVKKKILARGSVSAATAEAMAVGARKKFGSDVAIAITGIAGPTGATEAKPNGTIWLSVVGPEHLVLVHRELFVGSRQVNRKKSVQAALALLDQALDEAELEGII